MLLLLYSATLLFLTFLRNLLYLLFVLLVLHAIFSSYFMLLLFSLICDSAFACYTLIMVYSTILLLLAFLRHLLQAGGSLEAIRSGQLHALSIIACVAFVLLPFLIDSRKNLVRYHLAVLLIVLAVLQGTLFGITIGTINE